MGGSDLTYGSLFSGIGGIDLGMDLAGFNCAWQVEIDDYCREVLEEHWPGVPKYEDIYKVKGSEVEPVDILCGGFPCQPVSVAGKRGGVDDERWLWDEFYRLICEIRPRWVVAENVPGLLSANSGRAFAGVLRDLAEGGYDAVWDVYPAGGPGGVGALHKRERIFLVAYSNSSKQTKESGDVREESEVSEIDRKDIGAVVSGGGSKIMANTKGKRHGRRTGKKRRIKKRELQQKEQGRSKVGSQVKGRSRTHGDVSDTDQKRLQRMVKGSQKSARQIKQIGFCDRTSRWKGWDIEPDVGRVANGVPNRVDRLKALGNSVVPQVAYKVARMINEYTTKEK